jgi:hypothetical protein
MSHKLVEYLGNDNYTTLKQSQIKYDYGDHL